MKKIGKIGKINIDANRKLKQLFQDKGINYCEVDIPHDCNSWLTFAHRHKRSWYRGNSDLLSDFNQVILSCLTVHMILEQNSKLTEEVFIKLRGEEI
jgi:hypothetical protein